MNDLNQIYTLGLRVHNQLSHLAAGYYKEEEVTALPAFQNAVKSAFQGPMQRSHALFFGNLVYNFQKEEQEGETIELQRPWYEVKKDLATNPKYSKTVQNVQDKLESAIEIAKKSPSNSKKDKSFRKIEKAIARYLNAIRSASLKTDF
ncbi:MAG: hypothetical protein HQL54_07380 [Magnetococcales bacterium]|nr:hypothetical protein [Magnetococcales bacterium]